MFDRRTILKLSASSLAVMATSAACSSTAAPAGRRLVTADEASRMAETLFNNYEQGGADFVLDAQLPDGTTIHLDGSVDWVNHIGRATVAASTLPDSAVTEVVWSQAAVAERIPALTQLLDGIGEPPVEWFARGPQPQDRNLDAMVAIVTGLASQQRDNALLIAQEPGTAWLRSDTRRDGNVDVLQFGELTRYWLSEGGVTMMRFEGNNTPRTRPIVIDLLDHGPRTIAAPDATNLMDGTTIPSLYATVTGTDD